MISWKLQGKTAAWLFSQSLSSDCARHRLGLALQVVAFELLLLPLLAMPVLAQGSPQSPQSGPTRPWTEVAGPGGQSTQSGPGAPGGPGGPGGQGGQVFNQYSSSYLHSEFSPYWHNHNSGNYKSYNAPPGGYAPRYGNAPASQMPSSFGSWSGSAGGGGILSSQLAPTLPEGLVLPVTLDSSIDTERAVTGDYVQAHLSQNISAGGAGYLQGGSVISGIIQEEEKGEKHEGHAGKLSIGFEQLRLPNGTLLPLKAHLVGRIYNYIYRDTSPPGPLNTAWRYGMGSSLSTGMGSVFGNVGDGGHGPGSGAYAGAVLGGASMVISNMIHRRHQDIFLHPGTRMELQLDEPLVLPGAGGHNYNSQNRPGTGNSSVYVLVPADKLDFSALDGLLGNAGGYFPSGAAAEDRSGRRARK